VLAGRFQPTHTVGCDPASGMTATVSTARGHKKRTDALAAHRRAARLSVERLRNELRAVRSARSEDLEDDYDPEGATMSQLWSQSSGLLKEAEGHLAEIDAALVRHDSGEFGMGLGCGRLVDPARLDSSANGRAVRRLCAPRRLRSSGGTSRRRESRRILSRWSRAARNGGRFESRGPRRRALVQSPTVTGTPWVRSRCGGTGHSVGPARGDSP
jgi:RNA polymerase-binding transcription factor DksA